MFTVPIEHLPQGLRREIQGNPKQFTNADVMAAVQFACVPELRREFKDDLQTYLAYTRAYAAGGARRIGAKRR